MTEQFLTFTIGEEEYGVDIMTVREIKGWTETTRLPNSPEYMRGVMNLRGLIIPIFDLRARFTGALTHGAQACDDCAGCRSAHGEYFGRYGIGHFDRGK